MSRSSATTRPASTPKPPRLAAWLLRRVLPRNAAGASILGDLHEELTTGRHRFPRLWYWRQALSLFVYFLVPSSIDRLAAAAGTRSAEDSMLETLFQDLRYAVRGYARTPGFTVVALLLLALGIGATTALFSVVDAVLIRDLPYDEPARLVDLSLAHQERGTRGGGVFSPQDFEDLVAGSSAFQSLAGHLFSPGQLTQSLTGSGEPVQLDVAVVTEEFFSTLGVEAMKGRVLGPADLVPGKDQVAVLSHSLWRGRFGSDPAIIGRVLTLGGKPFEVVGVMPARFQFPARGAQLWLPITRITEEMIPHRRQIRWISVLGRLAPGVSAESAAAETRNLLQRLEEKYPESNEGWNEVVVTSLEKELVGEVETALLMLFGATALVLLTACANVVHLLLARATGRRRELAMRVSLGASRGRLLAQLLSECLLLTVVGGGLGLALAFISVQVLAAKSAGILPRIDELGPDPRVVAFALGISLVTGLLFGVFAAYGAARRQPAGLLREAGSAASGGGRQGIKGLLVAGEVAVAVVLVLGSALMLKSLWNLLQVDPGFETQGVLTLRLAVPPERVTGPESIPAYHQQMSEALAAVPGVLSVGASKTAPLSSGGEGYEFTLRDEQGGETTIRPESGLMIVTPGYFESLGISLLQGRTFGANDPATSLVLSRSLARELWAGRDPVGDRLVLGAHEFEILGVVEEVKHRDLAAETSAVIYVSNQGFARSTMNYYLRTVGDPMLLADSVRQAIWSLNPDQPIADLSRLEQVVDEHVARRRFFAALLLAFAGLATLLAALGVYGVVSYVAGQRRAEMGIRVALGARRADVLRTVLTGSLVTGAIGLGVGLLAALGLGRVLAGSLYGVTPTDPPTIFAALGFLSLVTFLAALVPALRATRVDPAETLRRD